MANPNWKKGMPSPNPSGRPKGAAQAVRELVHPARLAQILLEIAQDTEVAAKDRIAAAKALLDRGWGTPPSSVVVSVDAEPADARSRVIDVTALEDTEAGVLELALERALTAAKALPEGDDGCPPTEH